MDIHAYTNNSNNSDTLTARNAIVLYEGSRASRGQRVTLAALHPIDAGDGAKPPVIGAGVPLDRGTLELMLRQVTGQEVATGNTIRKRKMLSDILYMGDGTTVDRMVWHTPARRRPIFFRTGKKDFDRVFRDVTVLWSPLLFVAQPGSLRVYALASDTRPDEDTPIYYAPYYNLYASGMMCSGDIKIPDVLRPEDRVSKWETCFYESAFTHSNYHSVPFCSHPRGHNGLWRNMIHRQDFRGFPSRFLVPALGSDNNPLTVGKVIEQ